jgi:hypothetical protein
MKEVKVKEVEVKVKGVMDIKVCDFFEQENAFFNLLPCQSMLDKTFAIPPGQTLFLINTPFEELIIFCLVPVNNSTTETVNIPTSSGRISVHLNITFMPS